MDLYIPQNLKKLKIVDQLYQMYNEYMSGTDSNNKSYYENPTDSFSNYNYMRRLDPVKKFLTLCISEKDISEDEDYESVINYLTHKFYRVKGTSKVIDYMKQYFTNIELEDVPNALTYTTKSIVIKIKSVETPDQKEFEKSLMSFLGALLYFSDATSSVGKIRLIISETITSKIGMFVTPYNSMFATE